MHFSADLPSFYKLCSKNIALNIWVSIPVQLYEYTSGYDTVSYSNLATIILVHRLSQVIQNTHTEKPLVRISPIGMEFMASEIYHTIIHKIFETNSSFHVK